MENFFAKISKKFIFLKHPQIKILGSFLIVIGFAGENLLRHLSYVLANGFLLLFGKDISGAGVIVDKIFTFSAPITFVYIPLTIILWLTIRDGLQKLDWVFTPILIGILIKGGVYGLISIHYKSGDFWELSQYGLPIFLLWFLILIFFISALFGLERWFKDTT
ncbi:MAG: hypothetical protein COT33_03075 [Candidatus Nealsonbacteria bacterium CG08_land_8_20_14_0_20_38_20]|uniref:Uncharacterized protein n=1 Tax=Candidatus Nealsonbacteria bacterium CG08_land_8_20_14_0_20_38_20 TaxID=1974705 RepID=A0A2H0YL56_9BACT|nr:MAG: hypothetical protein COT33_03075 [Candidatus Nealsonbacteria bacterium CG08_land_8_20_14_0_20_38_20]